MHDVAYLGDISLYKVKLADGSIMTASVPNESRTIERGIGWDDEVWLTWAPEAGVLLTR